MCGASFRHVPHVRESGWLFVSSHALRVDGKEVVCLVFLHPCDGEFAGYAVFVPFVGFSHSFEDSFSFFDGVHGLVGRQEVFGGHSGASQDESHFFHVCFSCCFRQTPRGGTVLIEWGIYTKKRGSLYRCRPALRGLRIAHTVRTSNAEAHADMMVLPCRPFRSLAERYGKGCHITYPVDAYRCDVRGPYVGVCEVPKSHGQSANKRLSLYIGLPPILHRCGFGVESMGKYSVLRQKDGVGNDFFTNRAMVRLSGGGRGRSYGAAESGGCSAGAWAGVPRVVSRGVFCAFRYGGAATAVGPADSLGLFSDRLNLTADAFRYFEEHVSCAVVEQFVAVAFVAYGGVFH